LSVRRPRIPKETLDRLLVSCKHSCCICGREMVQIHHIDGDRTNNSEDNLIPLCLNHAGMVHICAPPSAGIQNITPSQLRMYKQDWIESCSSISPTIFKDVEDLRVKVVELEGQMRRISQTERRENGNEE
jgi:hypothetical protein